MKKKKQVNRKPKIVPKVDYFKENKVVPDYKNVLILRRFISDRGKVIPQKYSGLTAKNQRLTAKAVKRARYMALLPYTDKHAI